MISGLHAPCADCEQVGMILGPPTGWRVCRACDGAGYALIAGAPTFGAKLVLADRAPGEVVELVTGQRARVAWHTPRDKPLTTHVAILDDFDDTETDERIAYPSQTGVRGIFGRQIPTTLDDGTGAKGVDALDPFTRRAGAQDLL